MMWLLPSTSGRATESRKCQPCTDLSRALSRVGLDDRLPSSSKYIQAQIGHGTEALGSKSIFVGPEVLDKHTI
jgi:hypothetical protein